jgi:NCAIR mutase (PurE)-related protein
MHPDRIGGLLNRVKNGELSVEQAMSSLKNLAFEGLGFAVVDHHRELCTGFPEIILSQGKTAEQITGSGLHLPLQS